MRSRICRDGTTSSSLSCSLFSSHVIYVEISYPWRKSFFYHPSWTVQLHLRRVPFRPYLDLLTRSLVERRSFPCINPCSGVHSYRQVAAPRRCTPLQCRRCLRTHKYMRFPSRSECAASPSAFSALIHDVCFNQMSAVTGDSSAICCELGDVEAETATSRCHWGTDTDITEWCNHQVQES